MDKKCIQEFKKLLPADMPRPRKGELVSARESQVFIWPESSLPGFHCMGNGEINAGGNPATD